MHGNQRMLWLLAGNLIAIPILSSPSFGFIFYMDLGGPLVFVFVAWVAAAVAAFALWPAVVRRRLVAAYALASAAAFVPVVLAWGIGLHKLYWQRSGLGLVGWAGDALVLGGVFTAGYWLPASLLNCFLLRRALLHR